MKRLLVLLISLFPAVACAQASQVAVNGLALKPRAAAPTKPSGYGALWLKTDHSLHILGDTGVDTNLTVGGGGGSGTVTSIIAGTGLSGGTITASGTIAVNPALGQDLAPTNDTYKAGSFDHRFTQASSSWWETKIGSALGVSGTTITPTCAIHHLSTSSNIDTIAATNVPTSGNVVLTLIARAGGSANFITGGNIATAVTISIAANSSITFTYDQGTSTWYPAYITPAGSGQTLAATYNNGAGASDAKLVLTSGHGRPLLLQAATGSSIALEVENNAETADLLNINTQGTQIIASGTNGGVRLDSNTATTGTNGYAFIANGGTDQWKFHPFSGNGPTLEAATGSAAYIVGPGELLIGNSISLPTYLDIQLNSIIVGVGSNANYYRFTTTEFAPYVGATDGIPTLGTVSHRWNSVYYGSAVANQPACAVANDQGVHFTLFATSGAKSKEQVCLKGADDAYHWEDSFVSTH